jgi:hypothetical protein
VNDGDRDATLLTLRDEAFTLDERAVEEPCCPIEKLIV